MFGCSSDIRLTRHFSSFLNTWPPFMTNFTRSSSVISAIGSPATATRSANLPASTEPTRSCHPISSRCFRSCGPYRLRPGSCRTSPCIRIPWSACHGEKAQLPSQMRSFTPAARALRKLRSETSATLCPSILLHVVFSIELVVVERGHQIDSLLHHQLDVTSSSRSTPCSMDSTPALRQLRSPSPPNAWQETLRPFL